MDFDYYQEEAHKLAVYPKEEGLYYTTMGLCGEAGEIANKVKKVIRDSGGDLSENRRNELIDELSDTLWYCANLAYELGVSFSDVAEHNLHKLWDRRDRNKLKGSGDKR